MRGGLTLGSSTLSPADFFQGKHFFLYGEFPGDERRKLSRYVTAFNGSVRRGGGRGREGRCYLVGGKASGSQRRGTHAGWTRVAFPLLLISKTGLLPAPLLNGVAVVEALGIVAVARLAQGSTLGARRRYLGEWLRTPILCVSPCPARELEDYMSDRVQFVITAQEWDPSFEEVGSRGAGKGTPNLPCVTSLLSSLTCSHMHPAPPCRL